MSPEPEAPDGWEVFVSSAYPGVPGGRGPTSSPSSSRCGPSIVVAGAHGKTTTAAMIAFALRETGRDPSWIVGGEVPQLGANAGAGEGWLVVEGDESDRSVAALRPRVAVVTNVDLDHHTSSARARRSRRCSTSGWRRCRRSCAAGSSTPVDVELPCPGEHNRRNAAAALAALELAGVAARRRRRALARFEGVGRRFELVGEAGGCDVYDDYAHNPEKLARRARDARASSAGAHASPCSSSRTCTRERSTSAGSLAARSPPPTSSPSRTSTRRASTPIEGVTGKLVVDALCDARPGFAPGWTPRSRTERGFSRGVPGPAIVVLTVGAGCSRPRRAP